MSRKQQNRKFWKIYVNYRSFEEWSEKSMYLFDKVMMTEGKKRYLGYEISHYLTSFCNGWKYFSLFRWDLQKAGLIFPIKNACMSFFQYFPGFSSNFCRILEHNETKRKTNMEWKFWFWFETPDNSLIKSTLKTKTKHLFYTVHGFKRRRFKNNTMQIRNE